MENQSIPFDGIGLVAPESLAILTHLFLYILDHPTYAKFDLHVMDDYFL